MHCWPSSHAMHVAVPLPWAKPLVLRCLLPAASCRRLSPSCSVSESTIRSSTTHVCNLIEILAITAVSHSFPPLKRNRSERPHNHSQRRRNSAILPLLGLIVKLCLLCVDRRRRSLHWPRTTLCPQLRRPLVIPRPPMKFQSTQASTTVGPLKGQTRHPHQ